MSSSKCVSLYACSCAQSHTQVAYDHVVCCNEHVVVADRNSLSWCSLSENRQIWVTDVQRRGQMDVTADSEGDDARTFSFYSVAKCSFRAVVSKRCDYIFLSASSSKRILSTALSTFESYLLAFS